MVRKRSLSHLDLGTVVKFTNVIRWFFYTLDKTPVISRDKKNTTTANDSRAVTVFHTRISNASASYAGRVSLPKERTGG